MKQKVLEAIKYAHEEIKVQIEAQERLAAKNPGISNQKRVLPLKHTMKNFVRKFGAECYDKVYNVATPSAKEEDTKNLLAVLEEFLSQYSEEERADVETIC